MTERSRIKVLLVSPLPPPYGGIAHWTSMIRREAQEDPRVTLWVLDTAPKRRRQVSASSRRRLKEGVRRLPVEVARLLAQCFRERPDVVHINSSGQLAVVRDLLISVIASFLNLHLVYHLRFGRVPEIADLNSWEWRLLRRVALKADIVIALDARTRDCLREHLPQIHVAAIPNCISATSADTNTFGQREKTCLFVGWLLPAKGIGELLSVWKELSPAGWHLKLVGPGDATYLDSLTKDGIAPGIEFIGEVDHGEVLRLMKCSSVFVFPSHTEGFPNAVLEAMACGMSIVATDVGAISEMLEEGAGIVVQPRDTAELRDALARILADSELRDRLSVRAAQRARKVYSLETVYERYVGIWQSLSRVGAP